MLIPENKMDTPPHPGHKRKQGGHTEILWTHQKTMRTTSEHLETAENKADKPRQFGHTRKQDGKTRKKGG